MAHPGGRPTKFTPKVRETLAKYIELGATYEDACACAGISSRTFRTWMRLGRQESEAEQEEGDFCSFFRAIRQAEGRLVFRLLAKIEEAATAGLWRAAAWKLERRFPERYGRLAQRQHLSSQVTLQQDNLARSILDNPDVSATASHLFAALAGTPQSDEEASG